MNKGLPKKYAKMGFARGWKEYKKAKKNSPKRTRKRGYATMAKKKSRSRRYGPFSAGNAMKALVGTGVASLYEVFVSPMIPLAATIKNTIELVVGILLSVWKKMPMPVRSFGMAMTVINGYSLLASTLEKFKNGG